MNNKVRNSFFLALVAIHGGKVEEAIKIMQKAKERQSRTAIEQINKIIAEMSSLKFTVDNI